MSGWHPRCQGLSCDIRDYESVRKVVRDAAEYWGHEAPDVVVNATGYGIIGAFEDQEECDVRDQWETNVVGLWNVVRAVVPDMKKRAREEEVAAAGLAGRIIVFGSVYGVASVPGLARRFGNSFFCLYCGLFCLFVIVLEERKLSSSEKSPLPFYFRKGGWDGKS